MWFAQLYSCIAHAMSMVVLQNDVVPVQMLHLEMQVVATFGLRGCLYRVANFMWPVVGAC